MKRNLYLSLLCLPTVLGLSGTSYAQECKVQTTQENSISVHKNFYISDINTAKKIYAEAETEILAVALDLKLTKDALMLREKSFDVDTDTFADENNIDGKRFYNFSIRYNYSVTDSNGVLGLIEALAMKGYDVSSTFSTNNECEAE